MSEGIRAEGEKAFFPILGRWRRRVLLWSRLLWHLLVLKERAVVGQGWCIERMSLTAFLNFEQKVFLVSTCPVFPNVGIDSDLKVVAFVGSLHVGIDGHLSIVILLATPWLNLLEPLLLTVGPDALVVGIVG